MCRKRKASSGSTYPTDKSRSKRWKHNFVVESSEDEDDETGNSDGSSEIDEGEYRIKGILDESETLYLIDWEGDYSPTWEPKDYANDVAIRVWDEKKIQENEAVHEDTNSIELPPAQLPSPNIIDQTSDPIIDCAESETEQHHSQNRSPSPLFVPVDNTPESHIANEGNRNLDQKQLVPSSSQFGRPANTFPKTQLPEISVFEYVPESPVPPEYLLPDEIEAPVQTSERITATFSIVSTPTAPTASDIQQLQAQPNPKTPKQSSDSRKNETQHTQQLPPREIHNPSKLVDEIAETPSVHPRIPESQKTGPHSKSTGNNSQLTVQSDCCTLVSRIRPSVPPSAEPKFITTFRQTSSIPESTHATPNPANSSTPIFSQIVAIQSRFPARPTTATMDGSNQKKDTQSLSETMEKYSHIEGSTPREKIQNAYAQMRAKSNTSALQTVDASATPSSAGDIEPSAPVTIPETATPLSVRVEKEAAPHITQPNSNVANKGTESIEPTTEVDHSEQPSVQTIQPSALTVSQVEQAPPGSVQLGPSEFAISLPMDSRVKDDYERVLADESRNIRDFINNTKSDSNLGVEQQERLVTKMRGLLEQLSNVATHPDLNIAQHIKDSGSDLEKEAAWAEYSSAKFLFLGRLVQIASSRDLHLVIMVHGEKTLKVVERYLSGKGLTYTRPRHEMGGGTNLEVSMTKGSLSFGIQSTHSDGVFETYKSPSAIVALDASFNAKTPSVEHMRTTFARNGNLLPVIQLLVSNTSEHIERCFSNFPPIQRLRLLIQYTVRLSDVVGDLQDDALGVHEDAEEVLACLDSDNFNTHWPLPLIEPLQIVTSDELDSSLSQNHQPDSNIESVPFLTPPVQKRAFVDDTGEQVSKRQRVDPSQDTSQFTESSSLKFPSQTLDGDLQALEKNLIQMRTAHAVEIDKVQKELTYSQSRVHEMEKQLGVLQHRYESRTKDIHQLRRERDSLAQSKAALEQRVEKQKEELARLKDDRTQLRHELEQAREALKTGGGSMAELESAQEEIRRLTKENVDLARKAEVEKKQAEYTREQYQTASSVAAQSGNEIRQLKEENETLKRKVAGDACRLKELNMKGDEARHLSRVAELEATLASRDDLLRKKEDELREIRKNRPSTRSTSTQPRSPKWAAASRPTSPGINGNFPGRGSGLRYSSEMSI